MFEYLNDIARFIWASQYYIVGGIMALLFIVWLLALAFHGIKKLFK